MSGLEIDEDTAITIIVGLAALACVMFAFQRFSAKRVSAGVVWSILAAVLGFVALFFATFEMRLF
jgi:hypothetical protein